MRMVLAVLGLMAGLPIPIADAQGVYVPHQGRVVAVPVVPGVAAVATPGLTLSPGDGGLLRIDGLPAGAMLAVDGRPLGGGTDVGGAWIELAPGPHVIDVSLPGGGALRLTVVTPAERSGYQVVPKP